MPVLMYHLVLENHNAGNTEIKQLMVAGEIGSISGRKAPQYQLLVWLSCENRSVIKYRGGTL
jgi:hypothetical protein